MKRVSAAGFDCGNVDLLAFLPIAALGGDATEGVSDLWGWTDPITGNEYALVGRNGGIAFVDVTDPVSPRYVGELRAPRSGARDLKVYNDHLFFTGDGAGNHGLLVFDLNRLRAANNPPVQFDADAKYDGIASAHNLIIDTDAGFAYPVGASGGGETCGGGLHMVDIRDPLNPTFAGLLHRYGRPSSGRDALTMRSVLSIAVLTPSTRDNRSASLRMKRLCAL